MVNQFELVVVNEIEKIMKTKYNIKILVKRIHLWNQKLKKLLPKLPLQPDIDMLGYNEKGKELIGIELKVIYLTNRRNFNLKYYDGLDQALALQMFGFDKVYFIQSLVIQSTQKEQRSKILNSFHNYPIQIKKIIKTSGLSIGYTPLIADLWKNPCEGNLISVLDTNNSLSSLLVKPKKNPFLNSKFDHVEKIRGYLLNKYVKRLKG